MGDQEVRKDIPIPPPIYKNTGAMAALRLLRAVGDSVVIRSKLGTLGNMARELGLTGKYTARTQPDGSLRVWRTKD